MRSLHGGDPHWGLITAQLFNAKKVGGFSMTCDGKEACLYEIESPTQFFLQSKPG